MKFQKYFSNEIIPQWRLYYLDYEDLVQRIEVIGKATISIASAYNSIRLITNEKESEVKINVENLAAESLFWSKLVENVNKIEEFYCDLFCKIVLQFHILLIYTIRLGLISKYKPLTNFNVSVLENELMQLKDVLGFSLNLTRNSQNNNDEFYVAEEEFLFPLDINSTPESIEHTLHKLTNNRPDMFTDYNSWNSADEVLWGSDEEKRDYAILKNNMNNEDAEQDRISDDLVDWDNENDPVDGQEEDDENFPNCTRYSLNFTYQGELYNSTNNGVEGGKRMQGFRGMSLLNNRFTCIDWSVESLKRAWKECYGEMRLLKTFMAVNKLALSKILTKYERNVIRGAKSKFRRQINYKRYGFFSNRKINILINEIKHMYKIVFGEGGKSLADDSIEEGAVGNFLGKVGVRDRMSVSKLFSFGLFIGLSVVWTLASVMCIYAYSNVMQKIKVHFIIFRFAMSLELLLWSAAILIYQCKSYKINYLIPLGLGGKNDISHIQIIQAIYLSTFVQSLLLFVLVMVALARDGYAVQKLIPNLLFNAPLWTIPCLAFSVSFPQILYVNAASGWWVFETAFKAVVSPLSSTTFRHIFVSENISSISVLLFDIKYVLCYLVSFFFADSDSRGKCLTDHEYILTLLAISSSLIRLSQSIKNYTKKTGKISDFCDAVICVLAIAVTAFSYICSIVHENQVFFNVWIIVSTCLVLLSSASDIRYRWLLGNYSAKHKFLRFQILFHVSFYYLAMAFTPIGRAFWSFSLSPNLILSSLPHPHTFLTLIALFNIVRSTLWNLLALDAKQI